VERLEENDALLPCKLEHLRRLLGGVCGGLLEEDVLACSESLRSSELVSGSTVHATHGK
jgi:hypothetical protein